MQIKTSKPEISQPKITQEIPNSLILETLQFYAENELEEILFEKKFNRSAKISNKTETRILAENQVRSQVQNQFQTESQFSPKPSLPANRQPSSSKFIDLKLKNGSTDQAIAALARRQQAQTTLQNAQQEEQDLREIAFAKKFQGSLLSTSESLQRITCTTAREEKLKESSKQNSDFLVSSEEISIKTHFESSSVKKFLSLEEIVAEAQKLANRAKTIEELQKIVGEFEGCNLKKMATNTVFCDGNKESKIMVIGEARGNNEDLQGIPFCGDSGEVLTQMFSAINLHRQHDYYITNTLFWRPPGNRKPTEEELQICAPFVHRQIQLIAPKILILVGATAMNAVLKISDPISKIRGQLRKFAPSYLDSPTTSFTIFHPSFLMRQPAKKRLAWLDMLTIESFLRTHATP